MPNVLLDVSDRIATLTINRPEVRNALDRETVRELTARSTICAIATMPAR